MILAIGVELQSSHARQMPCAVLAEIGLSAPQQKAGQTFDFEAILGREALRLNNRNYAMQNTKTSANAVAYSNLQASGCAGLNSPLDQLLGCHTPGDQPADDRLKEDCGIVFCNCLSAPLSSHLHLLRMRT